MLLINQDGSDQTVIRFIESPFQRTWMEVVDCIKTELEMISVELLSVCLFPPSITDANFLF